MDWIFLLTEPDAGSDATAIKSSAIEKKGKYLINGSKAWVTNGVNMDGTTEIQNMVIGRSLQGG